jgi:hypothetical protein
MEDRDRDAARRSTPGPDDEAAPDTIGVYERPPFYRRYARQLILLAIAILVTIILVLVL